MFASTMLGIFDWIGDFFKALFNLIPKTIYLLYASLASLLDVLQLFFRKLAGLDVYYIDGVAQSGDLVTNFIGGILGININNSVKSGTTYSALSNVFWAMMIFGVIICFVSVFVAIIKSHYTYDGKTTPIQILYTGGKAIINMVAVPIIVLLGLFVSQALLTALDSITSVTTDAVVQDFGSGIQYFKEQDTVQSATGKSTDKTYLYYDIFGFGGSIFYGDVSETVKTMTSDDMKKLAYIGAKNQTFSGSLFRAAAYNANRARIGQYSLTGEEFAGQKDWFANAKNDEQLANLIDTAFANNMFLRSSAVLTNWGKWDSNRYFTNFTVSWVWNFSKFNVGAVWYYYDLWQFNFIVGFAGVIVCSTIFINIIFGLMTRLLMSLVLFLVAPPLFGLAPIKDAGKGWREKFVEQVLMAYGAVVGMNLVMMILPYFNKIDFFNIPIADYLARILFIIVGLITVKAVMSTISGLVGGADANKTGGEIAEEVGKTTLKAGKLTLSGAKGGAALTGAAVVGTAGLAALGVSGVGIAKNKIAQKVNSVRASNEKKDVAGRKESLKDGIEHTKNARALQMARKGETGNQIIANTARDIAKGGKKKDIVARLQQSGMTEDQAKRIFDSTQAYLKKSRKNKKLKGSDDQIAENIFRNETHQVHKDTQKVNLQHTLNNKVKKNESRAKIWAGHLKGAASDIKNTTQNATIGNKKGGKQGLFSRMFSGYKDAYTGNKLTGVFTDDMKKTSDKAKESRAREEEKQYKQAVLDRLDKMEKKDK